MDFSLGFNLSQTNLLSAVPVPVNQQPTAYSDSATTAYQTPVEIDLITNDIDLDGSIDASSAEVTAHPVNGVVTINASNGVATYTPDDGFSGADSFEYRVSDMEGAWSEPVAVNLLVEPLRRNFTYLEESGGMYYQLSEELLFTDFEWEFEILPEDDGDFHQLIAGHDCTLNLRAVDDLVFFINGATNTTTTATLERGKFNHINVKRVSGELTLTVNGVGITTAQDSTPFSVTRLGIREDYGTTSSFTGIIANLKMWNGGDRDTGSLVIDAPMGDSVFNKTIFKNKAIHLGPELADGSFPEVSGNWSVGNGTVEKTATDSNTQTLASVTAGNTYLVSFRKDAHGFGQPNLRDVTGEQYIYPLLVADEALGEVYNYVITPTITGDIGIQGNYATFLLSSFSVREVINDVPVITPVNITDNEVSEYTFDDNLNAWRGVDDIFHDSFGSAGVNKWVNNGDGSFTKLNADGYGQLYLGSLPLGKYSVEVTVDQVDNAVGLYTKDSSGNLNLVASYNATGTYQEEVTTVYTGGNDIWFDSAPNAEATISGIKVTKNFEVV